MEKQTQQVFFLLFDAKGRSKNYHFFFHISNIFHDLLAKIGWMGTTFRKPNDLRRSTLFECIQNKYWCGSKWPVMAYESWTMTINPFSKELNEVKVIKGKNLLTISIILLRAKFEVSYHECLQAFLQADNLWNKLFDWLT